MPLVVLSSALLVLLIAQPELSFFSDLFFYDFTLEVLHSMFFWFFNNFGSTYSYSFNSDFGFQNLSFMKLDYNYNYRTYFSQTYLHAAYNKHMKPYRNLLNVDRMFGDYNVRTYGKSKKHARAMKHTRIFLLLYSHTLECYAFNPKLMSSSFVMFYFKRHHFYSTLEMFYASIYLGMIYFFSFTYTRMIEDGSLNRRETEEIDEEEAQNHWYFFREDRRGVIEPSIEDNEEVNFAYPQHPVEWDDNGHFYRWEIYFFMFLFSFLICWGVSQSAASMFYYDQFIDLHFMGWATTFGFIFIFWRIFFLVQFFTYFNRFNIRRFLYSKIVLPIFNVTLVFIFKLFHAHLWAFFYATLARVVKISDLVSTGQFNFEMNLYKASLKETSKNLLVKFYRYIYSSFQKNLNFFEKRNIYDFLLSSNLTFTYNSKKTVDKIFYYIYQKDRVFSNIFSITSSYIDNYRHHNGFFFPKNMYLTTNKLSFFSASILPPPFPLYLDYFNVNDLPIWGADFFFSLNQNVFGVAEASENWFFSRQYNTHFNVLNSKSPTKRVNNNNNSNNNFLC